MILFFKILFQCFYSEKVTDHVDMEESNTEELQYFEDDPVFEVEISSKNDPPFDVEDYDPFDDEDYVPFDVEEYEVTVKGAIHQKSEDYEEDIKRTILQESEDDEHNIKGTISKKFYKCQYCAADFPSMRKLGVHMGLDHPEDLQDFETFECHLCKKKCYDSNLLARHLKRVHNDSIKNSAVKYHKKRYKPADCKVCGKYLRTRRAFEVSTYMYVCKENFYKIYFSRITIIFTLPGKRSTGARCATNDSKNFVVLRHTKRRMKTSRSQHSVQFVAKSLNQAEN